ncbi:MAG TPA: hypothetical protein VFB51_01580 [Solirubrobacterales bacterium]|nr:hypothetical protein [Solirubrobacterales bacterium]
MLTRSIARARCGCAALVAVLAALAVAGCGGDDEARSEQRPPVPVNISVQIGTERVTASPNSIGAGPVTLLVSNQSGAAQTLTADGPRLRRAIGPIPPDDTATVKLTMGSGEFTIAAEESAGLDPATLTVGPPRDTAQNELLLP